MGHTLLWVAILFCQHVHHLAAAIAGRWNDIAPEGNTWWGRAKSKDMVLIITCNEMKYSENLAQHCTSCDTLRIMISLMSEMNMKHLIFIDKGMGLIWSNVFSMHYMYSCLMMVCCSEMMDCWSRYLPALIGLHKCRCSLREMGRQGYHLPKKKMESGQNDLIS